MENRVWLPCTARCSYSWESGVNGLKSCILAISWNLIIILKNTFLNNELLKTPYSDSYHSTLVTVTFIGQIFYLNQS